MRIRHPRLDSPIQSPSTTNEMRKHLLNSSQGTSIKISDSQQCKSRQSSPRLSSTDGHVSSISGMSELCDDPTNTYLNPDFNDPQLMTKCDSAGPSPLAMLARTCQNIGNIMDCGNSSNRFLSSNSNSIRKQSTVSSIPVTNGRIISSSNNNSNNSNITKSNKPKAMNLNEVISSSFNRRNTTSKYLSSNDTSRLNFSNTAGGAGTDLNNSVTNTTGKTTRNNNTNTTTNNNNDSVVSSLTLNHNTTRQLSPISIPSTLFSQVNTTKTESNLTFNNHFLKSDDLHQTSNALAQLARLSSSFSLPETPKLNFTCFKNSNNVMNNRNVWNDIRNSTDTTTTNNNNNTQHDPNSLKRIKRRTNSNSKFSNTSDECHSPPSAKRSTKDNHLSFFMHSMNNYTNSHDSTHSNDTTNMSISSNMTTNIMNNRTQSPNCTTFLSTNEPSFEYKETGSIITNKDTQEKFSYQLARSFLDFFYGKLVNSINSDSNNFSSTTTNTTHNTTNNTTTNTTTNNILNNNNNHTLFKEDQNESINPLCLNNERRTLEWLTNTNLIHRQQTMEQLDSTMNHTIPTLTNTFPCLLCGQIFHGHTELCMHVYAHLLAFNIQESKKSNPIEDHLRLLHGETNPFQNNRSNGLLTGSKNDHSFMPSFFPPPPSQLSRSALTTTTTTPTTINASTTLCSVNYNNNNTQSHSITDANHSFNPSDLFQSYLSQWFRNFSSPHSNNQLNDMINHNPSSNLPWISSDTSIMNKSMDYKTWQNVLTAAYLYSLKETTTTGTIGGQTPTSMTNPNFLTSIPLQNSLHRNENSNYYDIFFGSKPYITPFPQS
ncbi:unnamed protein product [Schistosoma rodhaini]|uniref:C2H2-type domain-containing protein n=1 Tax=Schistosoma rodhaini TaxID=6188 RepID=A0AA85ESU6_9TREM|nr:unnamed protein product [Schistosoma rodhaini]